MDDIDWFAVEQAFELTPPVTRSRPKPKRAMSLAREAQLRKHNNWRSSPERPVITFLGTDRDRHTWAVIRRANGSRIVTRTPPSKGGRAQVVDGWMEEVPPL